MAGEQPEAGLGRVLVVGGTHGNERNAPWLLAQLQQQPERLTASGLATCLVLGNPAAHQQGRRYLQRDLNRCFRPSLLQDPGCQELEVQRARQLLADWGPGGQQPCLVALDLHSTTAAMGNCLVVYGRRPADLALAAAVQQRLGLPIYLHEADASQTGFLCEAWACGLVVEVGPVPQGVLLPAIVEQTALALEVLLECLDLARRRRLTLPRQLVVHRHLGSLDRPMHADGQAAALLHPQRQGRDWQPIRSGDPLFLDDRGQVLPYRPEVESPQEPVWPVFINEAAYEEKGIALSLTQRECWPVDSGWGEALMALAARLEPT